jgi:hypothetical protein
MDALGNLLLGFSVALAPIKFWRWSAWFSRWLRPSGWDQQRLSPCRCAHAQMDHQRSSRWRDIYGAHMAADVPILLNMRRMPVATCSDGYQMARNGRRAGAD